MTTRQFLVKCWIVSSVQFIDGQLPDGMGLGWTLASITMALVRHSEEERVRPDRDTAQGSRDGGIVIKSLISHFWKRRTLRT